MKTAKFLFVVLFIASLMSCNEEEKSNTEDNSNAEISTFYFIRHAEKDRSDSANSDPELTQDGLGRAMLWATVLDYTTLDAIYTTDYKRTSMTAAPAAVKKDLSVEYYTPGEVNIESFKAANVGKNVLVVGHSNTTPDFVNKMIGEEKYSTMDDSDNASLFIVQVVGNKTTDVRLNVYSPVIDGAL